MKDLIPKGSNASIITVNTLDFPLIKHVAILEKKGKQLLVHHVTNDQKNRKGGSLISEPMESFMQEREILKNQPFQTSKKQLATYLKTNEKIRYNVFRRNCEHFAYGLQGNRESPQLQRFTTLGLLSAGLIGLLIIENNIQENG